MTENVVRFADYERKSKQPDSAQPRDPATIIIMLPAKPREPQSHRDMEFSKCP
jgi:hypothetical protein